MDGFISHIGYSVTRSNERSRHFYILYNKCLDKFRNKQRERERERRGVSFRGQPFLEHCSFLSELLLAFCFPCISANYSHEITTKMGKVVKVGSPEGSHQTNGLEGDKAG